VLRELIPGGFNHYEQSLRIVDRLENDGQGLNLTWEVRDGIAKHSKGKHGAPVGAVDAKRVTALEGQVARVADMIAYVNHDIDDALRAGLLAEADLPAKPIALLGRTTSKRISRLVTDVILQTMKAELDQVRMSEEVLDALLALRAFLFEAVYENSDATVEFKKASGILGGLWEKVHEQPGSFLDEGIVATEGIDTAARDFLAGMTDRFAVSLYERLFIPKPWVELV
jgi:dGTPase